MALSLSRIEKSLTRSFTEAGKGKQYKKAEVHFYISLFVTAIHPKNDLKFLSPAYNGHNKNPMLEMCKKRRNCETSSTVNGVDPAASHHVALVCVSSSAEPLHISELTSLCFFPKAPRCSLLVQHVRTVLNSLHEVRDEEIFCLCSILTQPCFSEHT